MSIDRRSLIAATALTGAAPAMAMAAPARTAAPASLGVDATSLGVRAGGGAEQTSMLQQAIDKTAGARVPLILGPGIYRTATLRLPAGAQIFGARGATRLVLAGGNTLIAARGADHVTLAGLTLDGGKRPIGEHGALIHLTQCAGVRIQDCELVNSGGNGIFLEAVEGLVASNLVADTAEVAIFTRDARGLAIQSNTVQRAGNGGILVHRSAKGDDGTLVVDNRIEDIANTRGG